MIVYIARRPILEEVSLVTILKIQGYTHWYHHGAMAQAYVLIGLPHKQDNHRESSMTFEGEPAETKDEAKEKGSTSCYGLHLCRLQHFHQ